MGKLRFDANLKWLFTEVPVAERFDAAASAGFDAVELPSPYAFDASELRRRLDDAGLHLVLINTPAGDPTTPQRQGVACSPEHVQRFRDEFAAALDYATALDSDFIHVMAGIRPPGISRDRAFARFVTNIAWAADQAASTGVRIVLEAQNRHDVPGFFLDSHDHAAAVVEALGTPTVGLMIDLYHAQRNEGDLSGLLARHLDSAFHIQIADTPGRHEPGTGEIDFPFVLGTIGRSAYAGRIGLEYAPAETTLDSLTWMKETR